MSVYVVLEGGLVQDVVTDDPYLLGREVVIVDYDVEQVDEEEISQVEQGDGSHEPAFVHYVTITRAEIKVNGEG